MAHVLLGPFLPKRSKILQKPGQRKAWGFACEELKSWGSPEVKRFPGYMGKRKVILFELIRAIIKFVCYEKVHEQGASEGAKGSAGN